MNGETLHEGAGAVSSTNGEFIEYEIATWTGNSGGPIWTENGAAPRLVGVHVSAYKETGRARRVNKGVADEIGRMIASLQAGADHCN
jgi:V8-like Glu-specific endopeptidase